MKELKLMRSKYKIKQIALAKYSGIPTATISRFENGWWVPKPNQVEAITKALETLGVIEMTELKKEKVD